MAPLATLLLALLAATAEPAAPAIEAPADEALVERFMTVIPDPDQVQAGAAIADPAELARLAELNRGREAEIRPVLETYAVCAAPHNVAIAEEGLRFAARRLGSGRLMQLIRFYEGEDFRRFSALAPRLQAGNTLTAAEQAELDRILAAYPLMDFSAVMTNDLPGFLVSQTDRMAAIDRCMSEKDAALARLGVETQGPDVTPVPPPNPVPNAGQ